MIEIEVYAHGLRQDAHVMNLRSQMDLFPKVRYKIDLNHDIVYFELDEANAMSLSEITDIFAQSGLHPRFVGEVPPEVVVNRSDTMRLQ
jgi:hypothetical protein